MRQIRFESSAGCEQFLITIFTDGTVEVEGRLDEDQIWHPIREVEVIEIEDPTQLT